MRTVLRRSATLLAGLAVMAGTSVVGFGGTANAGTYCAVTQDGAPVYSKPSGNSRVINKLRKGPEIGCGSSSSPHFAVVTRLDNNVQLGYARWSALKSLGAG